MASWNETQLQERILEALRSMGNATIQDVSRATKINRITVSKYLAVMSAKEIVSYKQVGNAKLYSHKSDKSSGSAQFREVVK